MWLANAETIGLIVVGLVGLILFCDGMVLRIVVPIVAIGLFVSISSNVSRDMYTSARKAAAESSDKTAALPQTVNPRAQTRESASTNAAPPPAEELPQTKNPRRIQTFEDEDAPPVVTPNKPTIAPNSILKFEYTPMGMQAKREEFIFRHDPLRQDSDARARILNSMYQELLETSVKTDPGLRRTEDGCAPLRGLTRPHNP